MNYITSFFRREVLFNVRPEPLLGANLEILMYAFGGLMLAALALTYAANVRVQDKHLKKGLHQIRNILAVTSLAGFLYTFFAFEGAVFLAARFWLVLIGLSALACMFFPIKYMLREVPIRKAELEQKRNLEKYLPR